MSNTAPKGNKKLLARLALRRKAYDMAVDSRNPHARTRPGSMNPRKKA